CVAGKCKRQRPVRTQPLQSRAKRLRSWIVHYERCLAIPRESQGARPGADDRDSTRHGFGREVRPTGEKLGRDDAVEVPVKPRKIPLDDSATQRQPSL